MTTLSVWLFLVGVWPFADPGHDDLGSPLVWLDLALHLAGAVGCWQWWRARAADRRRCRTCGDTQLVRSTARSGGFDWCPDCGADRG